MRCNMAKTGRKVLLENKDVKLMRRFRRRRRGELAEE